MNASSLKDFILKNVMDIEPVPCLPSELTVKDAECALGMTFGPQLKDYLLSFGSLSKGAVELYGLNEVEKLKSDLVSTTLNVAEYYAKVEGHVVIDNYGDGQYVFCDQNDMMFKMPIEVNDAPVPLNIDLTRYLCARLNEEASF